MNSAAGHATNIDPEAAREELGRILGSDLFRRSARSAGFLRYVVERTLEGQAGSLKEYVIALEVFHRPESYDSQVDATVRVEAGKLRARLQKYYDTEGHSNPVRIEMPKGGYVPVFRDLAVPPVQPARRWWRLRFLLLGAGAAAMATIALAILAPWRKPPGPGTEAWAEMQYGGVLRNLVSVDAGKKGLEHFRRAVALAPDSPVAHAELANACLNLAETEGIARPEVLKEAVDEAQKALLLDPQNASAHYSLGQARLFGSRDWQGAAREMRHAVDLDPSDPHLHMGYARYCLIPHRRFEEALEQYRLALKLEPASSTGNVHMAATYLRMGKSDIARRQLLNTVEMYPESPGALVWLGIVERLAGRNEEAIRLFREALRVSPEFAWAYGNLGFVLGKLGRRAEAEGLIRDLNRIAKNHFNGWDLAAIYTGLEDREAAFAQFEVACQHDTVDLLWLNVDYRFNDLHDDPRFTSLLKRLRLND